MCADRYSCADTRGKDAINLMRSRLTCCKLQAWLIESDRLRKIINTSRKEDFTLDLETDVTPFVSHNTSSKDANNVDALSVQAEVFIGKKSLLQEASLGTDDDYIDLTIMNSSNPLFPDYA
jgi:hypothetical protein